MEENCHHGEKLLLQEEKVDVKAIETIQEVDVKKVQSQPFPKPQNGKLRDVQGLQDQGAQAIFYHARTQHAWKVPRGNV